MEVVMVGDLYWWLDGCVEGVVMGWGLKQECGWVHMLDVCLCGNWVCARDLPWRFLEKILSWIRAGQCGGFPGWIFQTYPNSAIYTGLWLENGIERNPGHKMGVSSGSFSRTRARLSRRMCGWKQYWNGCLIGCVEGQGMRFRTLCLGMRCRTGG